jgi:glycosyltransferase involved in cell wall biosynthesis
MLNHAAPEPAPSAAPSRPQPLVSVVVPLYNHAEFVGACLDSVYGDEYPEIEILVLDDGSSDGSFEAVEAWRRARPGRFRSFRLERQENRGVTRTLNRLVELARGEFIAPLGSDDMLLPGGLRARVEALEAQPGWLAVFGDCIVVDRAGRRLADSGLRHLGGRPELLSDPAWRASELIVRWAVPGPVFLARRRAYRGEAEGGVGPYDESLAIEDKDFYLRLEARRALGYIDRPVAAYRLHDANSAAAPERRQRLFESLWRTDWKLRRRFRGRERTALTISALRHRLALGPHPGSLARRAARKLAAWLWDRVALAHSRRTAGAAGCQGASSAR